MEFGNDRSPSLGNINPASMLLNDTSPQGKRRKAGKEPKQCERRTKIFGDDLKIEGQEGFGAFKRDDIDEAHLGTNSADLLSNKDVGGAGQMHSWEKHLKKTCNTDNSCFKFIN